MGKAASGDNRSSAGGLSHRPWFVVVILALCMGLAWLLIPKLASDLAPAVQAEIDSAAALAHCPWGQWLSAVHLPCLHMLLMALWLRYAGQNILLFQFVLYGVSVVLTYWYARAHVRPAYALIVTALYAVSPMVLSAVASLGPEVLVLDTALVSLLLMDRYFGPKNKSLVSNGRLFACGFWVVLSILTSAWGYALLLTFWVLLFRLFDFKKAMGVLCVTLLALLPFYAWTMLYGGSTLPLLNSPGDDAVLPHTVVSMLGTLRLQFAGLGEYDFSRWVWVCWLIGGFTVLGLLFGLARHSGAGGVYVLAALGLWMMGVTGHQAQTLLPLLPLLLLYLYFGVMRFGEWMKQLHLPVTKIITPVLTLVILAGSASHWASGVLGTVPVIIPVAPHAVLVQSPLPPSRTAETPTAMLMLQPEAQTPQTQTSQTQAAQAGTPKVPDETAARDKAIAWMAKNTLPEAVIGVSRMTMPADFETPAMGDRMLITLPIADSPAQLLDRLTRYDDVLEALSPQDEASPRTMDAFAKGFPDVLKLVYDDPAAHIRIWRVNKPK